MACVNIYTDLISLGNKIDFQNNNDFITETKRGKEIGEHILIIDEALRDLDASNEPENSMYSMTKKTLLLLQEEVQHKMSQVIAAEFELRRQMCEIQNSVRFFKHEKNCSE